MTFSGGPIREVKPFSFIYEVTQALPADMCLKAIRRFEASTDQQYRGRIGQVGEEAPEVKRSTDLRISGGRTGATSTGPVAAPDSDV
jgi:hypothetical protein